MFGAKARLQREVMLLRGALTWYANGDTWRPAPGAAKNAKSPAFHDRGLRARMVLGLDPAIEPAAPAPTPRLPVTTPPNRLVAETTVEPPKSL